MRTSFPSLPPSVFHNPPLSAFIENGTDPGDIEEVGEHSDTISTFRDRPEAESLLIVIDIAKAPVIREVGEKRQFIVVR